MNIFILAELELTREGKLLTKNNGRLLIDRAIKIRKYLDYQNRSINAWKSAKK